MGYLPPAWPLTFTNRTGGSPASRRALRARIMSMMTSTLEVGLPAWVVHPRRAAGWAWVDQHGTWRSGGLMRGTNQVAELLAVLNAVRDHMHVRELTVEIDSAYAMKTYMEWMDPAARRGWTTQAGKPTSNVEVIMDMMRARNARIMSMM